MHVKYTVGPWQCYQPHEQDRIRDLTRLYVPKGVIWRISARREPVCLVFRSHPADFDPTEGDVRLMAAAPALLAACEAVEAEITAAGPKEGSCERWGKLLVMLRAAMEKGDPLAELRACRTD